MNTKRITTFLFSIIAAIVLLGQTQAFAYAIINEGETKASDTVLLDSTDTNTTRTFLYIYGIADNAKITNVKSSNSNVVEIVDYYCEDEDGIPYIYVGLKCKKSGTSTISLNVDGTTYTDKVSVENYKNPIGTLTISGINSGKNLKSAFDDDYNSNLVWAGNFTAKNNTIKVKTAKPWKVTRVYIYENNIDHSEIMTYTHTYKNPSSVTVKGINIWGNKSFNLTIDLYNTKTKGTASVCYAVKAFEEK